jgi:hypothetical protein
MNQKLSKMTKKTRYLYPPDMIRDGQTIDTKRLKKIGSWIMTDCGCRMRLDDYEDNGNARIIRKVTILSVSIIN